MQNVVWGMKYTKLSDSWRDLQHHSWYKDIDIGAIRQTTGTHNFLLPVVLQCVLCHFQDFTTFTAYITVLCHFQDFTTFTAYITAYDLEKSINNDITFNTQRCMLSDRKQTYRKNVYSEIIMAALCSRCGHYIFVLWFLLLFFFPCLISAVAGWMSIIIPHMMWP